MDYALTFEDVSKVYETFGSGSKYALKNVSFEVANGRKVAVIGRSGSGKSTLLHMAAGIDVPSSGTVRVHERDLNGLSESERTLMRRDDVGLIFQFFHLLPHLSVYDNVSLPALISGDRMGGVDGRVMDLLGRVGLADRARDTVQKLSGGEMQRVAICRALLRKPRLLLADEPTGNLDDENGQLVMDLLLSLVADEGTTLLYVTHSREFAKLADEVWEIHSGEMAIS
ncbi:MAG: putative ABC transport system ATP-binding protein [Candidatus Latescibacterota bacterium]|jgi:ABC-type lipoprotein export system ATPase subunit